MTKNFYCHICKLSFSSGYALADHFRSIEHKEKALGGNLDSLIEKFTKRLKESIAEGEGDDRRTNW